MIAPAHIRGKLSRHSPQSLKDARLKWVRENADLAGDRLASALGISRVIAAKLRRQAGVMPQPSLDYPERVGIRYGVVSRAVEKLPYHRLNALQDAAARTGQTMAEVLAQAWAEQHTQGTGR